MNEKLEEGAYIGNIIRHDIENDQFVFGYLKDGNVYRVGKIIEDWGAYYVRWMDGDKEAYQKDYLEECVHEKDPEESNWHILDDSNGELEEYFDRMNSKPKYKVGDILKNSKDSVLQITSITPSHKSGFEYECFVICWDGHVVPSIGFHYHELQLNFDLVKDPKEKAFFLLKLEAL